MPSFENRVETLRKELDRLARENQALRQFVDLYKSFTTKPDAPGSSPKQVGFFQAEAQDDGSVKFAAPDERARKFFAGDIHIASDSDPIPVFSPDLEQHCREVVKTRRKKSVEIPYRKGDKSYTLRFDLIPYFDFYQQVKRIACYVLDVTETYTSSGAVDAMDRAFEKFASLSDSIAWLYDPGTGSMRWSKAVEDITGKPAEQISGDSQRWLALVHPEDVTRVKAAFQRLLSDGFPYNISYRLRRNNGSYVSCREQAYVVRDVDGAILRAFGTVTLEDGEVEKTTAKSVEHERYFSLLESTNDIVIECDNEGRVLSMNSRGAEALGYEKDEGNTHWLDDYFYFSDGASYSTWLKSVLDAPRRNMEMRTIRAGRVRLYLNCHTTPVAGKDKPAGFILVATDVTAQRQALQEFRSIFESSRDGIILHRRGIIQRVNKAASRQFGVGDPAQFAGKNILDLVHPDDRERIREYLEQSLQGKEWPGFFEMRGLRTNGSSIDLEVSASYLSFEDEPTFMLITRDITQRKLAEGLLKQSEAFFRTLIEHSPDFVVLTDREGITMYVNPAFTNLLGHDPSFLANKNPLSIVHPKDRFKCLRAAVKVETTLGPARVDVRLPHVQGEWVEFEALIVPLIGPGGHIDQYFISARDVSERKKAEARATQGESRYRVLFDAASDGLFVFNASGLIIDVNTSACELTGYTKEELLG
ncbi:MAG: PAS domain S-box protein, partial [Chlorobi bacterium]|nr:PAS domain S-box protein [Chlorobiota bacterium]